ncbi:MAG: hypothetical protein KGL95_07185 [Patescibacteria group bacterium]|nr:hypothetical protein [Patescibacteria group bacterium]
MKHFLYYLSLAAILAACVLLIAFLKNQKSLQVAVVILMALFYVIWGVVHHAIEHSFSIKIMLEYIAIALLSISLVLFVLNIAL